MTENHRTGRCLCGALRYTLSGPFGPIWNCHCSFCRRAHGATFTTVAMIAKSAFRWSAESAPPKNFTTQMGSVRHFCGTCATPICNFPLEPTLVCVVVASLDEDLGRQPWGHVNLESKAGSTTIADGLPQFAEYPSDEELVGLIKKNLG